MGIVLGCAYFVRFCGVRPAAAPQLPQWKPAISHARLLTPYSRDGLLSERMERPGRARVTNCSITTTALMFAQRGPALPRPPNDNCSYWHKKKLKGIEMKLARIT